MPHQPPLESTTPCLASHERGQLSLDSRAPRLAKGQTRSRTPHHGGHVGGSSQSTAGCLTFHSLQQDAPPRQLPFKCRKPHLNSHVGGSFHITAGRRTSPSLKILKAGRLTLGAMWAAAVVYQQDASPLAGAAGRLTSPTVYYSGAPHLGNCLLQQGASPWWPCRRQLSLISRARHCQQVAAGRLTSPALSSDSRTPHTLAPMCTAA